MTRAFTSAQGVAFQAGAGILFRMSSTVAFEVTLPSGLAKLALPAGVQRRLHELLDKQDSGVKLTVSERKEAEGLVDLAELLSLLKLRAGRKKAIPA
jgi:hypothetical protein